MISSESFGRVRTTSSLFPFHSVSKTESEDFTDPSVAQFRDEPKHTRDAAKSPRLPVTKELNLKRSSFL
jgi:hypothetical protein